MKTSTTVINRLLLLLAAMLLAATSVWAVSTYYAVEPAAWIHSQGRIDSWERVLGYSWFPWAMLGVAVLSLALGLGLILANLASHRFSQVESPASSAGGHISLHLSKLAKAAAEELEAAEAIESVTSRVFYDNTTPTAEFKVRAAATSDIVALRRLLTNTERDLRAAIPGVELASIYKLQLSDEG